MGRKEIEWRFVEAGWELDDGFGGHLVIGEDHHVSILAPRWAWETGDPAFELCDGERGLTCWVREVPTPRQAAALIEEHGGPPEEERGNPREEVGGNREEERHRREA